MPPKKKTEKSTFLQNLVGRRVCLVDKYADNFKLSSGKCFILKEIDYDAGYFVGEAEGHIVAFNFDVVKAITEMEEKETNATI